MKPVHGLVLITGALMLAGLALAPFHELAVSGYVVPIVLIVCLVLWAVSRSSHSPG